MTSSLEFLKVFLKTAQIKAWKLEKKHQFLSSFGTLQQKLRNLKLLSSHHSLFLLWNFWQALENMKARKYFWSKM